MNDLRSFTEIDPGDVEAVGGKGLSLGLLTAAGLPVPPGFCITTAAHRRLRGRSPRDDAALATAVTAAYRQLGGGRVAVRSSATAEDGSEASFAGQQETILGVQGEEALLEAVARCWASLDTDRAVAYRRQQGIADNGLTMAVVVQRLVPAEVAGVLFTIDPFDPAGRRMLVEASWGVGEAVVSGRVTPDRYALDRERGTVVERHVAAKSLQFSVEKGEHVPVPPERQSLPCLTDEQLRELAELGRHVEQHFQGPRDIEWAYAEGRFWLLQARPITTVSAQEREQVRQEEIAILRARAEPGGTVWARFNLAEILPDPTPMTWAIVRRLMAGKGGFGETYRDLGYQPEPSLDEEGIFDLICGRPYCNLSREPRLYARGQPLEHDFAALKAAPHRALYPRARPNWSRAGWAFWMFYPIHGFRSFRHELNLQRWCRTFADRLRSEIIPAFTAETTRGAQEDLTSLEGPALLERLEHWVRRTLIDFARDSLKATVLAAVAMGKLEYLLTKSLGPDRARAALGELVMGVRPDIDADLPAAVRALATGAMDRATFLDRFGHRGPHEMELAQPRWAEGPAALDRLIAQGAGPEASHAASPGETWERIASEAKLSSLVRPLLEVELKSLHEFLALRESGKHALMRGYALIRRVLVALDQKYRLQGGVFFLAPEELPRLVEGHDYSATIAERRRRRKVALSLEVPQVLFSDDLEAIGRPQPVADGDTLRGVPLSAGVAEGPALVLEEPDGAVLPAEAYILVCPSTDPAWVPLFVHARGLVMETGGVLSHGAIVAREFGLPAAAGIAGVHRRLKTGQRLRLDGATGTVTLLDRGPEERR